MTRLQFFIGVIGLWACTNFLIANSLWLFFVERGFLTTYWGEYWYFKSQAIVFPALLFGVREMFKNKNTLFFIAFDLYMWFSLLGLLAEFIGDATKYYLSQYVAGVLSLAVSSWQYYRLKKKLIK